MPEVPVGSYVAALAVLFNRGARYGTVIDLGCADGTFCLTWFAGGLFPGSTCVNVDANALYEPSLRDIQSVLGGHYVIAAISDRDGEIELDTGSHPYWASAVSSDHSYWSGGLNRPGEKTKVRAYTLDTLVRELALKPPFLLKLDLQCGELAALRGGAKMLAETDVVVCETATDEFAPVCEFLHAHDHELFDLTEISRYGDGTLTQLYPVFLHRRLDRLRTKDGFGERRQEVIELMAKRRAALLIQNTDLLAVLRAAMR